MDFKQVVLDETNGTKLDIYNSATDVDLPGIVILPGGSYKPFKQRDSERVALTFLTQSYQAFVLEYPINEKKNYQVAKQSITTAFDYIIKHANDLKVNPQNIGIIGFSAGGQLAAAYSCEANNHARFAILGYPVINQALDEKIGIQSEDVSKLVTTDTAPTFIFGAREDGLAQYVDHIQPYTTALFENEVPFELHVFGSGGHGFSLGNQYTAIVNRGRADKHFAKWFPLCLEWLKQFK
ncbi:alpha/beta hydrolase (plasmid) [Lactiplantibacillus plantarum]|uniref:Alpha/beta hydrolase n=1 Tax=Lactiplantibacillus plantarum TaxID=1590 RepID=A0AAX1KD89_LACPN|nr:alpha/beta hydrolase [Lactiplantibacillus plantarum]QQM62473.1 alpha/beta hydrolase [Lactiplantibacillus plantarum]